MVEQNTFDNNVLTLWRSALQRAAISPAADGSSECPKMALPMVVREAHDSNEIDSGFYCPARETFLDRMLIWLVTIFYTYPEPTPSMPPGHAVRGAIVGGGSRQSGSRHAQAGSIGVQALLNRLRGGCAAQARASFR
jgi:hypothetical protein